MSLSSRSPNNNKLSYSYGSAAASAFNLRIAVSCSRDVEVCWTHRWRKTDSNSRSLREGKGCGQPLQASIAVSDLNL